MYKENVSLKCFTTFYIGGVARRLIIAKTPQELTDAYSGGALILGLGSNVLISDKGYDGTVIINRASGIYNDGGGRLRVYSGTTLSRLCAYCIDNSLTGFEWAAGIPASVGGALIMNAGAWGGTVFDSLTDCTVLRAGKALTIKKEELNYGYRKGGFEKGDLIICATFSLKSGDGQAIAKAHGDNARRKAETQPRGHSAGSVFLNADKSAGYYIDNAGLKGYSVNDAKVSEKHANFIINTGSASAADVVKLIKMIKVKVYARFGVMLKEEIKYIGEF